MNPGLSQTMWCKATLQYPTVGQLPLESVGDMLNKASNLATTANFQWSFIDEPVDGSIFLVYVPNGSPVPPDGFMYMDSEQPYSMNVGGKLVEIWEHKYGFIPGQEQYTSRSRRRFRLGGKNPNDVTASLWILFYSRTGEDVRVAANPMLARPQPIRKYPLPNVQTKPFNLFQAMPGAAQMPNNQQQMQQQFQMQQMQQLQAQQAQHAAMQAQHANQGSLTPGRMPPQMQQQQQQRPMQQGYPSPYSAGTIVPQKRTHVGQQTPTTPAQHLPPDVVARMQRGETLADGIVAFEEPVGDTLDALLPIDVSRARFARHHEWMEELYSAYPTSRITSDTQQHLPDELSDASLNAQIAQHEAEMQEMKMKHEMELDAIKHPQGKEGRVKAALETFATSGGNAMDPSALDALEADVGIRTAPWTSVKKVAITSS